MKDLLETTDIHTMYVTEIQKGRRLSKYVVPKV